MEKIVDVGGKKVCLRATALTPRLYRHITGRDMMRDINGLSKAYRKAMDEKAVKKPPKKPAAEAPEAEQEAYEEAVKAYRDAKKEIELDVIDMEVFENLAYVMARQGDASIPGTADEWLDGLEEPLSIYTVLPELLKLWTNNTRTTSIPKKKQGKR